jgi:predicted small metal-binding protein
VLGQEQDRSDRFARRGFAMGLNICRDLGIDCSFQSTETTADKIMREFIDHASSAHKMEVLSAEVILKVQRSIKK